MAERPAAVRPKHPYVKPPLEPTSIFGADTTTCCRASNGTCSRGQWFSMGKSGRSSSTS